MSIQSNVNQMLSVASVLASMNPTVQAVAKERVAVKDLKRKNEKLEQVRLSQAALIEDQLTDIEPKPGESPESYIKRQTEADEEAAETLSDIGKSSSDIAANLESQMELRPSTETYKKIRLERTKAKQFENFSTTVGDSFKLMAQEALTKKQQEVREGRPKFNEIFDRSLAAEGFDPKLIPADVKKELKGQLTHSQKIKMRKEFGNG